MSSKSSESVGDLVEQAGAGDERAASELMPIVYDELRRIAGGYMRRERVGQTIQPTALVHEAYLRLLKGKTAEWQGRTHFLAVAAISMRQILIERARAKKTVKRGGERDRITLDESVLADVHEYGDDRAGDGGAIDLLAIDAALHKLAEIDAQQARIVELRFFGGLTIDEAAESLGISPATVKRHWTLAKAWLRREVLEAERPDGGPGDGAGEDADGS